MGSVYNNENDKNSQESIYENIKNIIDNRNLQGLKDISDDLLNQYDHLLLYIIKLGWNEGIKEYQERYHCWAWTVKNCFTIWNKEYDPHLTFKYCPEKYRQATIESINSYGHIIRMNNMMIFPKI
jgi:hypothetical protein